MLLSVSCAFAQEQFKSDYTVTDISLKTKTGEISGTLTIAGKVKKSPLVVIIAGSGPTDRNGNSSMGIETNCYKLLSEALASKGISSLRYDKRGIGQSAMAMMSEADLRFETYSNDAADWVTMMKKDKRFSRIIIVGHSEGSLLGMIAAQQSEASAYISIAGAGKPIDILLQEQLRNQLPFNLILESNAILDSLKMGKTVTNVNPLLLSLYRPSVQPYMISWIKYDPAKEIHKLHIPVLIIQGSTDIQVSIDDAKLLSEGKPDAKLSIIKNMNHILKECDSFDEKNKAQYKMPDLPLDKELIEVITDFIK